MQSIVRTESSIKPAFAFLVFWLGLGMVTFAQNNDMWVGNTSANWADSNWSGANNPPTNGDLLFFGAAGTSGAALNNNLGAGTQFSGFTFNNGASAFIFSGNGIALTNSGGIANNSSSLQTINFPIVLTANVNVNDSGGGTTFGGVMSGSFGLTNIGSGTVKLNVNNTFSGGVAINNGTVLVSTVGSSGGTGLGGGNTTVNAGATLVAGAVNAFGYYNNTEPKTININGGTVKNLTGSYTVSLPNLTFTGGMLTNAGNTGNPSFSFLGSGGSGANVTTYSNNTTAVISTGLFDLNNNNGNPGRSFFEVGVGNVTGGATPGVDLLITSIIRNKGSFVDGLVKDGLGVMALDTNNTYSGGTTISNGVLQVGTANDASVLREALGAGAVTDYASLSLAGSEGITISNVVSGSGGLVVNSGTNTLLAVSTYTGPTTISNGALIVRGSLASGSAVTIASGALGGVGVINGTVATAASGAQVNQEINYLATSAVGTLTLGSLNMSNGGACYLDVSTSYSSGNDLITVSLGGTVALSRNTFHINALSGATALDTTGNYILIQSSSLILGTVNATPVWDGTPPSNSGTFIVEILGNNVVLHSSLYAGPAITSATASPSSATRYQNRSFSVTVTNGTLPYTVTVDTSSIGGSSTLPLVLEGSGLTPGIGYIYSNTVALGSISSGNYSLPVSVTDGQSASAFGNIALSLTGVSLTWNGDLSGNDYWDTGGELEWQGGLTYQQGDFVTFDDTSAGVDTTNVNLLTTLSPGSITISNTTSYYSFNGAGNLSGNTSLFKLGSGTLTLTESGGDNFSGGIIVSNGTVILDNAGSVIGGSTTIGNGAVLQVGNNDDNGNLPGSVVDNGLLIFNRSDTSLTVSGSITGSGTMVNNGSGTVNLTINNPFSGGVTVNSGTLQVGGLSGANGNSALGSGDTTVNADGILVGAIANAFGYYSNTEPKNIIINGGTVTDVGTANYTISLPNLTFIGGTLTSSVFNTGNGVNGNYDLFGSSGSNCLVTTFSNNTTAVISAGIISLNNGGANPGTTFFNVAAGNVTGGASQGVDLLITSVVQDNGSGGKIGAICKGGLGVMVLDNNNTYSAGTTVSNGVLQLGTANDTSALTQPLGPGPVTNYATLNFASSQSVNVPNIISGPGAVMVSAGTLSLYGGASISNTSISIASGATFDVSGVTFALGASETLAGNGIVNGSMLANGTISPGLSGIGSLTFNNNLTINGNLLVKLNKSLVQSNDFVVVNGSLNNTGIGTLTVNNLGPALAVGDKFTLFSQALPNGNNLTIYPPAGVTFTNNLTVDGSIQVLAVNTIAPNPTNITFQVRSNTLNLSWPTDHLGWIAQSNSVSLINTNFWFDIANSQNGTNLVITMNPGLTNVFYRLRHP